MKVINGNTLRDMILSGAGNLQTHKQEVNDLNVFPVPDGDTGTNMSLTMQSAVNELVSIDNEGADKVSSVTASALLRGARGNSGVITSLLFRGMSKSIAAQKEVDAKAFAAAYKKGVEAAYKAVMKPTEGTILTVSRLGADAGIEAAEAGKDMIETFETILEVSRDTLEKTPEMLPVLKQAGVVDSGGQGLLYILEGMYSVLKNGVILEGTDKPEAQAKADFASFDASDIEFAYCTEFLVNKNELTVGKDVGKLHKFALSNGDSVVFVDDDEIIKIHVHTNHPGKVIEKALEFGFLSKMKIENMKEQLEREKAEKATSQPQAPQQEPESKETTKLTPATPVKKYGFVAVTAGEGMNDLFMDLGADGVVFGGQTMNPSADDIYKVVENVPAEVVFIFPNNKNIIMAAQLVVPLSEKQVVVVPTRTVPEGVSAMLAFDESVGAEQNLENMQQAASAVKTGQVTYAVRDSVIGDTEIKEGEIMGLCGGEIKSLGSDVELTTSQLVDAMVDENSQLITVYYGDAVKQDEATALTDKLAEKYPELEIMPVCGKQPVYYYIVAVE